MSFRSLPNNPKITPWLAQGMESLSIRRATRGDVDGVADLIVRMKRLNNEFDPLFAVVEDANERAKKYVVSSISSDGVLLLVGSIGKKVVGVLRAELRERRFYNPGKEGHITDFYVLPEFRRKALGNQILDRAMKELKKMGANIITAEVPSQNEIAVRFYNKRGFRSLLQVFARDQ